MRFDLLSSVSVCTATIHGCFDVDRLEMLAGISRACVQSRRSFAVRVPSLLDSNNKNAGCWCLGHSGVYPLCVHVEPWKRSIVDLTLVKSPLAISRHL